MDYLTGNPQRLPKIEDEMEDLCLSQSTLPDTLSSSSFLSLDTSMSFDDRRRHSSASMPAWASPEFFSASASSTLSPTTPIYVGSASHQYPGHQEALGCESMYNLQHGIFDAHDAWQGEMPGLMTLNNLSDVYLSEFVGDTNPARIDYRTMSQCMNNPALSRPMFREAVPTPSLRMNVEVFDWTSEARVQPQTIAPSAAFQPVLSSSPIPKECPSTPPRHFPSSVVFSSSPSTDISPVVLPSQHDVDEPQYTYADHVSSLMEDKLVQRQVVSRLSRRQYERKGPYKQSKPKSAMSRSVVEIDAVIPQYEHACSYDGCQKHFKRQEHKKRHEKTVHESHLHPVFKCWVPHCKTPAFTRTDNLKSHLRNTHGKKSANARNRYVASQDKDNKEFYAPSWVGNLTEDGYPVE